MRLTRILPTALVVLALSACGGGAAPTAADPDLRPRMNGGSMGSGGSATGGGILSTGPTTGTTTVTPPDTTTQNGGNRGGFIGSGT